MLMTTTKVGMVNKIRITIYAVIAAWLLSKIREILYWVYTGLQEPQIDPWIQFKLPFAIPPNLLCLSLCPFLWIIIEQT